MNEQEKIEQVQKAILNMAKLCKDYITRKKEFSEKEKCLKDELRKLFLELPEDLKKAKLKDAYVEISVKFPKSFDQEHFKVDNPVLAGRYFKTEMKTITTTIEEFNEKKLASDHPEIYEKYRKARTPSLTIK